MRRPPPTPHAFQRAQDGESPFERMMSQMAKKPQPAMEEFREGVAALRRAARLDPETFEDMVERMLRPVEGKFKGDEDHGEQDEEGESRHGPTPLSEDNRFRGPLRRP